MAQVTTMRPAAAVLLLAALLAFPAIAPGGTGLHDPLLLEAAMSTDPAGRPDYGTAEDPLQFGLCRFTNRRGLVDVPGWLDLISPYLWRPHCDPNHPDSAVARVYAHANTWSHGSPDDRYWVVSANNEPWAFNLMDCAAYCNPGPPGRSLPIVDAAYEPGVMGVAVEALEDGAHRVHLRVSHRPRDVAVAVNPPDQAGRIPWLSFGASRDAGNGTAISVLGGRASSQWLTFTSRFEGAFYVPGTVFEHWLQLTAQWGGRPRMLLVALTHFNIEHETCDEDGCTQGLRRRWNWPIRDSMYHPGAEVAFVDAEDVEPLCGMYVPRLQCVGEQIAYRIHLGDLYRCVSDLGLFSEPMPEQALLTDVHFANEVAGPGVLAWHSVAYPAMADEVPDPATPGSHGDVLDCRDIDPDSRQRSGVAADIRRTVLDSCAEDCAPGDGAIFTGAVPFDFGPRNYDSRFRGRDDWLRNPRRPSAR